MMSGHLPWPYPRHVSTHQANFAYGEIAGFDTLGRSSLPPGQDTPILAYPPPLLSSSSYKLTTDEPTGDGRDNNVEILRELFESKLTYDCIQNLEWYLIEPSRKTRNDSAKYQTNGASLLQVSSYC